VKSGTACSYTLTRTWRATDACGNISEKSQVITVKDTTPPVITGVGAPKVIECPGTPVFSTPSATDTCGGAVSLTKSDATTAICGNSYKITRTWTAKDACGNISTASQTITVTDTTAPVITCPPDKSLACGAPTDPGATGTATATDSCGGAISITYSDATTVNASGDTVITRTWKATDACGNSATCTQKITVKAGYCDPGTFNFSGSSATTGSPNIRTFTTANGVNVKVSGWSRDSSGKWLPAYVGSYSGGLGVTDTSEDGSAPNHTLDNVGRKNYLLFEFDQPVIPSSVFIGYVSGDSDMTVKIGTFSDPYTAHLTLSDSVVASFGYTEDNDTTSTTTRTANFNAGGVAGNAMIIAASLSDTTPDDYFKVKTLDICKPTCAPPPPPPLNVCVRKATVAPSCAPSPSNPLNHAMWMPGIATDFDFIPTPGSFVTGPGGTAKMSGTLRSQSNPLKGFAVVVNLSGFTMVPPAGSPKKELQACAYVENGGPVDASTWAYYTTFTATLTGVDTYAGAVITLVQTGPAFQIGYGANGKNFNFGASSWFKWTVVKQPTGCPALLASGQGDFNVDFYDCAQFTTFTQGGWGAAPHGNNPGALLADNFDAVYGTGCVIIGSGTKTVKFTSALAIQTFLPSGGTPNKLDKSYTDPSSTPAGVLASQTLALKLNLDFSNKGILPPGLSALKVAAGNKLAGKTVAQVLTIANSALAGTLPTGCTYGDLATLLGNINGNFDNGTTNNGYLVP
jgi:hypothetical protein